MSDAPEPAQTSSEAEAPTPPEHPEYLTSGARFRRWNLVTLILGLVCLAVGLWVVHLQRQAQAQGSEQTEKAE